MKEVKTAEFFTEMECDCGASHHGHGSNGTDSMQLQSQCHTDLPLEIAVLTKDGTMFLGIRCSECQSVVSVAPVATTEEVLKRPNTRFLNGVMS